MSLFSTIAHPDAAQARGSSVRGVGLIAVGLVLGVAIGMVAAVSLEATNRPETVTATRGGPAHDEFIRLNTTDLEYLSPAVSGEVVEAHPAVDSFLYWNITAFEGLAPASGEPDFGNVSDEFLEWNIYSLEYPAVQRTEQPNGPR